MSDDAPVDIPDLPPEDTEKRKPRLRKLRFLLLLIPLGALAIVSTIFGMMMAVASDLPDLENRQEYKHAQNSLLTDVHGRPLGVLANNQNRIIVPSADIAPLMKRAVVAVEDQRFYEHGGIDSEGILRAGLKDLEAGEAVEVDPGHLDEWADGRVVLPGLEQVVRQGGIGRPTALSPDQSQPCTTYPGQQGQHRFRGSTQV